MPTTQKPKQTKATQKVGGNPKKPVTKDTQTTGGKSPIVRAKAQAKTSARVGGWLNLPNLDKTSYIQN